MCLCLSKKILFRTEMKRSFAFEESDISSSEVQDDDVDFDYVEEDEIMEVRLFFAESDISSSEVQDDDFEYDEEDEIMEV